MSQIDDKLKEFDERFDVITMLCRDKESEHYGTRKLCADEVKSFLKTALLETEERVRRETEKDTMERCASELEESLNNESNEIDDEYALIAKWKKGG